MLAAARAYRRRPHASHCRRRCRLAWLGPLPPADFSERSDGQIPVSTRHRGADSRSIDHMYQAARLEFERVMEEFVRWHVVPEGERSPAPAWWWGPAMAMVDDRNMLPRVESVRRNELRRGRAHHSRAVRRADVTHGSPGFSEQGRRRRTRGARAAPATVRRQRVSTVTPRLPRPVPAGAAARPVAEQVAATRPSAAPAAAWR